MLAKTFFGEWWPMDETDRIPIFDTTPLSRVLHHIWCALYIAFLSSLGNATSSLYLSSVMSYFDTSQSMMIDIVRKVRAWNRGNRFAWQYGRHSGRKSDVILMSVSCKRLWIKQFFETLWGWFKKVQAIFFLKETRRGCRSVNSLSFWTIKRFWRSAQQDVFAYRAEWRGWYISVT